MKIAISAKGGKTSDLVDPRFGRCQYFQLYDTETKEIETVQNIDAPTAESGAGVQTAELVANQGAEVVITGHCGPKAYSALQEEEIKIFSCSDSTVEQAIEQFNRGELAQLKTSTNEGHQL